jgi:hypothetical protein
LTFLNNIYNQILTKHEVLRMSEKVQCSQDDCEEMELPGDLINGMCHTCHELDPTPTSEECDHCPNPATINICGTDLCDDCHENFHH